MMWIDPRVGSKELRPFFSSFSIPITDDEQLDSGDIAFTGRAIDESGNPKEVMVGIERKALPDFVQCMDDARFVGFQLQKMTGTYHFSFLFVEGMWRPDEEGYVEYLQPSRDERVYTWRRMYRGRKIVLYSALVNHLNTLRMKTRLHVIETADKRDTAYYAANLYKWFNDKEWDAHRSHLREYDPTATIGIKASLVRKMALQLPGIGAKHSAVVDRAFKSVKDMANSNEEQWIELEGIGRMTAQRIVKALKNER